MLRGTSSQTAHALTSEELGGFRVALAPESNQRVPPPSSEHPWLGRDARREVDFPEDASAVSEYMQMLLSEVRISTATYTDGQPATHVRIVRTGGDEYFAVAWQLGLEHMASLRGTTRRTRCSLWTMPQRSLLRRRTLPPTNHPGLRSSTCSRPLASTVTYKHIFTWGFTRAS